MNKDQVKGSAKNIAGKVQEQAGKLLEIKNRKPGGSENRLLEKPKRRWEMLKKLSRTR